MPKAPPGIALLDPSTRVPVGISPATNGDVENDDPDAAAEALAPALPSHPEQLADRAREYVEAASSPNTRRAYDSDWKHFDSWCRRQSLDPLPLDPQIVGLYITAWGASPTDRYSGA